MCIVMKNLFFVTCLLLVLVGCNTNGSVESFKDNGYQEDTVYISGKVQNFPEGGNLLIAYPKSVEGIQERMSVKPDSLGYFEARIPVINSVRLYLYSFVKGKGMDLFAEPGEKIEIHSDWMEHGTLKFSGEHARSHQDVYDYGLYLDSLNLPITQIDYMDRKVSHEDFLKRIESDWSKKDSLLKDYCQNRPQMSERAVRQLQISYLNRLAFLLMQRRFVLDIPKRESFPEFYMQKADSIFRILPRPYTLVDLSVFRDYLDYYNEHREGVATNMKMMFDYIEREKGIVLTEEQRLDVEYLNTPEMKSAMNEAYQYLSQLPEYEAALIDRWAGGVYLVPIPNDLKELMLAHFHYFCLDGMRKAMFAENFQRFQSEVKNPVLARPVVQLQEELVELENQKMESKSLMDASHLKDCRTGEELFREILNTYKGKIVYLDVWGVWCTPCKQQMQYVPFVKQAMKGKDVVFLYLANNSPDVSWKNTIKEYKLLGEQVVHYNLPAKQQEQLEEYLQVKHYPTYILIDRKGNIVDRNPPRPKSQEKLVDYLNDWLEK